VIIEERHEEEKKNGKTNRFEDDLSSISSVSEGQKHSLLRSKKRKEYLNEFPLSCTSLSDDEQGQQNGKSKKEFDFSILLSRPKYKKPTF